MRPHQLRDDQRDLIRSGLPGRVGSVGVTESNNRRFIDAVIYRYRAGIPLARPSRELWRLEQYPPPMEPLGEKWRMGHPPCPSDCRRGQRIRDDRQHHRASPSTQRRCQTRSRGRPAIGKSKGGLSTKIHVLVDALGNPLKIILTAGQVHDLAGADALVPGMEAEALLADKAYDADKRVIEPLETAGKTAAIPPKKNRTNPRTHDKALYEARHLIESFFCWVTQFRAIAIRYDKTARNFLAACHMVAALCWLK